MPEKITETESEKTERLMGELKEAIRRVDEMEFMRNLRMAFIELGVIYDDKCDGEEYEE